MEELTVKALDEMIEQIIQNNQRDIKKNLLAGSNNSMTTEEIFALMTKNCLPLSIKLSVQIVFSLLQSQGILEIDDREIAKLFLKHLSSGQEE